MKFVRLFCLMAIGTLLITACGNKPVSQTTGWNYNDSKWGGFEISTYNEQMTGPGLVFIEGGSFLMGRVSDDPHHQWNNMQHTVTVSSF
ncbi:MAG: hypothetical protein J5605_07655 [Bacteroidales bacterium]|nr:hypothetical protein [Bacteroidales bacterium]